MHACYCRCPVRPWLLALALLGACGKANETAPTPVSPTAPTASVPTSTDPAPALIQKDAASGGYCRHEVTGAVTGRGESPGSDLALTADYFMTREEHRRAYLAFGVGPDEIDERMKHDPLMNLFTLHCEGFLDLFIAAGDGMKYADFPFAPGTYPIAPQPNRVNARFFQRAESERATEATERGGDARTAFEWITAERGQFVLERFDGRGAAGSFSFDARVPTGNVHVAGTFDLPCMHPTSVCSTAGTK